MLKRPIIFLDGPETLRMQEETLLRKLLRGPFFLSRSKLILQRGCNGNRSLQLRAGAFADNLFRPIKKSITCVFLPFFSLLAQLVFFTRRSFVCPMTLTGTQTHTKTFHACLHFLLLLPEAKMFSGESNFWVWVCAFKREKEKEKGDNVEVFMTVARTSHVLFFSVSSVAIIPKLWGPNPKKAQEHKDSEFQAAGPFYWLSCARAPTESSLPSQKV